MGYFRWTVFLLLPVSLLSSCYWTNIVKDWPTGYRADLVIMPNISVNGWVVDILTDDPLDKFEAWKGSVQSDAGGKQFKVSSKCYNHLVYSCQCLVIPHLVKHQPGQLLSYRVFFNNQEMEMCDQQPDCGQPLGTSPAPTNNNLRLLDFDDLSWMKEGNPHTCFLNPCKIPTSCQAPSEVLFTCRCPELYLNIDTDEVVTDGLNAYQANPCEKEDLNLNLALAMSEKEINETVALLVNANETSTSKKRLKRSSSLSKVYIYSFADTVQSIGNIMKAQNVCRLFSELEQLDRAWPDSSLTCSQARARYVEIETVLDTFQLEEMFSLAMEYRKISSAMGIGTIKNTGELWFSFFLFYLSEWLSLVQCNYSGAQCLTMVGNNLCKYGDCCAPADICTNMLGGYTCTPCPVGTMKIDNTCQPIKYTPYKVDITTTPSTNLLAVVAGQEIHCPYQEDQFANLLCTEWCQIQELQHGLKCAEALNVK